ncbi:MAG: hypothetical protein Q9204_009435 [Flavoplaca sp. TL-2023a]
MLILSLNREVIFPECRRTPEEKTAMALSAAHDTLHQEVQNRIYSTCIARLIITPDKKMGLPTGIEWSYFRRIDFFIEHPQNLVASTWEGMEEVITSLHYEGRMRRYRRLPKITIKFEQTMDEEGYLGDPLWTQCVPPDTAYRSRSLLLLNEQDSGYYTLPDPDGTSEEYLALGPDDRWLRGSGFLNEPIVTQILDFFLDLPRCRDVIVHSIQGLDCRCTDTCRHDMRQRFFDDIYMEDMLYALELWLIAGRAGIIKP